MKSGLLALSLCLLTWQISLPDALAAGPEPALVLVSSATSNIDPLSADEVRKLYLGDAVLSNGHPIKPLRNHSDGYVQALFMQRVIQMSAPAYERRILSRIFREGGSRPLIITGLHKLINALQSDPYAVSYMYSDEASAHPELKILSVLWDEQN